MRKPKIAERWRYVKPALEMPGMLDKKVKMGKDTGMETKRMTHSAEETKVLAAEFAKTAEPGSVIALSGDLGAGKTTFAQGLLEAFGAEGPYVSPTFVIMKEYDFVVPSTTGIRRVYHVDAYRIDDPSEMAKLGSEEWFTDPGGLVLIEWPEKLGNLIPLTAKKISFRWVSDSEREIVIGS